MQKNCEKNQLLNYEIRVRGWKLFVSRVEKHCVYYISRHRPLHGTMSRIHIPCQDAPACPTNHRTYSAIKRNLSFRRESAVDRRRDHEEVTAVKLEKRNLLEFLSIAYRESALPTFIWLDCYNWYCHDGTLFIFTGYEMCLFKSVVEKAKGKEYGIFVVYLYRVCNQILIFLNYKLNKNAQKLTYY